MLARWPIDMRNVFAIMLVSRFKEGTLKVIQFQDPDILAVKNNQFRISLSVHTESFSTHSV